jgi:hypothetical protein
MSVSSPHTIHPGINRNTLLAFAPEHRVAFSPGVSAFLRQP